MILFSLIGDNKSYDSQNLYFIPKLINLKEMYQELLLPPLQRIPIKQVLN